MYMNIYIYIYIYILCAHIHMVVDLYYVFAYCVCTLGLGQVRRVARPLVWDSNWAKSVERGGSHVYSKFWCRCFLTRYTGSFGGYA